MNLTAMVFVSIVVGNYNIAFSSDLLENALLVKGNYHHFETQYFDRSTSFTNLPFIFVISAYILLQYTT